MPRRLALAVVAGLSLLALLSGCVSIGFPGSQPDGSRTPISSTAPTAAPIEATLEGYYGQRVDWSACGAGMECASVTAPLDWDHPEDGRSIQLAVTRHPATGKSIGSLLMNPGGPGASGFEYVHDYWSFLFTPAVAEAYDLVGWDPRGVGRSAPVECYTDPADVEFWLYGELEADPRTDEAAYLAESRTVARDYIDACVAGTGEVLGYIDTASTVRDLDLLRAVLGDERLNYLGFSYGTEIGQQYIDAFPEHVGRIVLDGVTDPSLTLTEVVLEQQAGFELALTNFLTECPARLRSDCVFSGDPVQDKQRIHDLVLRLGVQPLPSSDPGESRVLTADTFSTAVSQALYNEGYWPYLNAMFAELFRASPSTRTAFLLADDYYGFDPKTGWANNMMDAFTAINCLDYVVERDLDVIAAQDEAIRAAAPTLSDWWPVQVDPVCGQWPYSYDGPEPHLVTGEGVDHPILVVSTKGDPATPYEWGVRVANALQTGALVTYLGEGHTAYGADGPSCVIAAVDHFLLTGEAPATDPQCRPD